MKVSKLKNDRHTEEGTFEMKPFFLDNYYNTFIPQ